MKFEDLNDYASTTYYVAPNENPLVVRDMVKNLHIRRAAGICSAGEVGFFSLLSSVRQELVLVDHSYTSLAFAMIKYLMLRERGWSETTRLLTEVERVPELRQAISALSDQLPDRVKSALTNCRDGGLVNYYDNRQDYQLREIWKDRAVKLAQKATRKLDRVSFLHGDLTDLAERGPFDLLYVSNAFEHYDRNGSHPVMAQITKAVKPGGYIIGCGWGGWGEASWEQVSTDRCTAWTYTLYRTATA